MGKLSLTVKGFISHEPDRGVTFVQLAPRLIISSEVLEASGLLGPGSRVRYAFLAAGEEAKILSFRDRIEADLPPGARLDDLKSARPGLRAALERAGSFLSLAALVSVLVAGAAVAMSAWRQAQASADLSAIMRTLGASRGEVMRQFAGGLLLAGFLSAVIGSALGYGAQNFFATIMQRWIDLELPAPTLLPFIDGVLVALVSVTGFGLAPALSFRSVSVMRVFRRDMGAPRVSAGGRHIAVPRGDGGPCAVAVFQY